MISDTQVAVPEFLAVAASANDSYVVQGDFKR